MSEARASPRLVVRESNGTTEKLGYRLFWEIEGGGFYPALEFTFAPFETVDKAVAFGEREYGVTAGRPG